MSERLILGGLLLAWVASSLVIARFLFRVWGIPMEPIAQLLTGIDTTFRGTVLVPLAIVGLVLIGLIWMIGNQRSAQEKATAFFIGLAVVIGAPRIVAWVQSIVH